MLPVTIETLLYKGPTLNPTSRASKHKASASATGWLRFIALRYELIFADELVCLISLTRFLIFRQLLQPRLRGTPGIA